VANLLVRTLRSIRKGTVRERLAARVRVTRKIVLGGFTWIIWSLGTAKWQCRLKSAYLRAQGAQVGGGLFAERGIVIKGAEGLRMGNNVGIGSFSLLTCAGGVIIEDEVNISTGCRVISANHRVSPVGGATIRQSGHILAPVHLKRGCWLATNAIVLPGVTVGEGAVVIAGSLVTKDVPDYAYVGGVPARFFMYREGYKPPPQ